MIPCVFADLGKTAKDLLDKKFHFGVLKLDHKAKTSSGVNINVNGSQKTDSGDISAHIKADYKLEKYGVTFMEKWTTDSVLTEEVTFDNCFVKGLKKVVEFNFEPNTGKRTLKSTATYKRPHITATCDLDFKTQKPLIHKSLMFGFNEDLGYLCGGQLSFNSASNTVEKFSYGAGVKRKDFEASALLTNNKELSLLAYQKIANNLETAFQCGYTYNAGATTTGYPVNFALAVQYTLEGGKSFFKTRINNKGLLGMGYGFTLFKGTQLVLGLQVDSKNLEGGRHQVGASLEFDL